MGVPVDVTFHPSWWHANAGVNFNEEFFCEPQYRVEADIKMRKLLYEKFGDVGLGEKNPSPRPIVGSDLIASGYLFSQIMGCDVSFYDANPPEVRCANLSDECAMEIKAPNLHDNVHWRQILSQFDYLKSKYGYVQSHINLQGIQNIAIDIRGTELFIDYIENKEIAHNLIKQCTELMLEAGKEIRRRSKTISFGVSAITRQVMQDLFLTSNCTVEMISASTYEQFLLQADIRLSEEFIPFGIHHCGKSMEHVVRSYKKVKNIAFAEVGAGSDILKVREALPGVFLNLRYSPVKLMDVSEDQLICDLKEMASAAGSMYSISCVGIDKNTDDRQVRNFINGVRGLNFLNDIRQ